MNVTKKELHLIRGLLADHLNAVLSFAAIPDKEDPGQQRAAEQVPDLEGLLRRMDGELQNVNFIKQIQVEDA